MKRLIVCIALLLFSIVFTSIATITPANAEVIDGAGCLTRGEKNKSEVDKYGREALEKTITDAVSVLNM